ncbi:MAG TPA: indole-3-glycerol-phosphate synthase TrpC, partial [Acidimicrobiia bacterium]|nr:indole-3-glycerol-phosphate synthase TrpC [Acidimicrobiia bacterium]
IDARIIGVNSRDLATFREDLGVAFSLAGAIPPSIVAVAESAIRSADDARAMADAGFDAVLVGEALVRAADPLALAHELTTSVVARRK